MDFEFPKDKKTKESKEKKKAESEDSMFASEPFKEEPQYKTVTLKKKGFYVYSIGRDLIDDKALSIKDRSLRNKDVLFIVIDK